jgi:hypothetical protein
MKMSLVEFKDAIVNPLKTTIEQHKSATLAQFSSRDDLTKQWDRAEGMTMSLNHIEGVYSKFNKENPEKQESLEAPSA